MLHETNIPENALELAKESPDLLVKTGSATGFILPELHEVMNILNNWSIGVIIVVFVACMLVKYKANKPLSWGILGAVMMVNSWLSLSVLYELSVDQNSLPNYPGVMVLAVIFMTLGARLFSNWLTDDPKKNLRN